MRVLSNFTRFTRLTKVTVLCIGNEAITIRQKLLVKFTSMYSEVIGSERS